MYAAGFGHLHTTLTCAHQLHMTTAPPVNLDALSQLLQQCRHATVRLSSHKQHVVLVLFRHSKSSQCSHYFSALLGSDYHLLQ